MLIEKVKRAYSDGGVLQSVDKGYEAVREAGRGESHI